MKGAFKIKSIKGGIAIILFLFLCCESKEKPASVLSHEEMVRALAEVYLTEEKVARLSLGPDSAAQVFYLLEGRVFEKLNIPDSVFRESMNYYTDHPAEMEKIYSALVDSLALREQRSPQVSPVQ